MPFVKMAKRDFVVPKYLNNCESCLSSFSEHAFASIRMIGVHPVR